jgi:hypothetical protein
MKGPMPLARLLGFAALLSPLSVSAKCHADTFTFTPSNGDPSITFSIGNATTPTFSLSGEGFFDKVVTTDKQSLTVTFLSAAYDQDLSWEGYGLLDLEIYMNDTNLAYFVDGAQLYSGNEYSPTFLTGTYDLTPDPANVYVDYANIAGGILAITNDVAVTPEPSSIALLATGVLGTLGIMRRLR